MFGVISAALFAITAAVQLPPNDDGNVIMSGSSTVAPFALAVSAATPRGVHLDVHQGGTGVGLAELCGAVDSRVDIAAASRRIKVSELKRCAANGIPSLLEIEIGLDGIVFAQAKQSKSIDLTEKDIYLALARKIPRSDEDCIMVSNNSRTWKDVRADLPSRELLIIGPAATSGTRDMLIELLMKEGARSIPCLARLEKQSPAYFERALALRTDGPWVDGGENDHAIAHTLLHVRYGIGVFGFSHLRETPGIVAVPINGTTPSVQSIGSGSYKAVRNLYLYTTVQRMSDRPSVEQIINRFFDVDLIGPTGALSNLGLARGKTTGQRQLINTSSIASHPTGRLGDTSGVNPSPQKTAATNPNPLGKTR